MQQRWYVKTIRNEKEKEELVSLNTIKKGVIEGKYVAYDEIRESKNKEWRKLRQSLSLFGLDGMLQRGIELFQGLYREKAIRQFRNMIDFKDSVAEVWLLLAILIEDEDPGEAEKAYDKCIGHNYKKEIAYNNKGVLMVRLNEADIAFECFEKSIQFSPELAAPHYNLGMIYRHFHRRKLRKDKNYEEEYKKEFRMALELDRKSPDKLDDLWGDHRANFFYEEEIPIAFGTIPDRDWIVRKQTVRCYQEGSDYLGKGEWDKALTSFSIALRYNPDFKHKIEEGIRRTNEGKRDALNSELEVFLRNGAFDKAVEIAREIISLGISENEIGKIIKDIRIGKAKYFYRIGLECKKDERYEEARENFRKAGVAHQDFIPSVNRQIADIDRSTILLKKVEEYRRGGEYEKAVSIAKEIFSLGDDFWNSETERLIDKLRKEKAEKLFDEGKEAMNKEDYSLAEVKFAQVKDTHPSFNDRVSQKINDLNKIKIDDNIKNAKQLISEKKWDEAISLADSFLDDRELQLLKEKAKVEKLTNLWERARESEIREEWDILILLYEEILSLEPQNLEAQEALKKARKKTVDYLCFKGERELEKKDWNSAKESFEEALTIDPSCKKALQGRGDSEYKRENPEEPTEEMDKARGAYVKGKKYSNTGSYDKACEEFKVAIEIRPDYEAALDGKEESFQKKINSLFSKACGLEHENNEEAFRLTKEILKLTQGQHEKANQLQERIKLHKRVNGHLEKAHDFEKKDPISALKEYNQALESDPKNEMVQQEFNKCMKRIYSSKVEEAFKKGDKKSALGSLREVVKLFPEHSGRIKDLLFDRVNKLNEEGRYLEALDYLEDLTNLPDLSMDIEMMKRRITPQLSFFDKLKHLYRKRQRV